MRPVIFFTKLHKTKLITETDMALNKSTQQTFVDGVYALQNNVVIAK